MYGLLAALALCVHLLFIVFCVAGGLLCLHRLRWIYWHVPALVWGAATELFGIVCPLTYLENWLLVRAGQQAYAGDFIAHYLLSVIYPQGLGRAGPACVGRVAAHGECADLPMGVAALPRHARNARIMFRDG